VLLLSENGVILTSVV